MPAFHATSLEHALQERDRLATYFRLCLGASTVILLCVALITAWRFDETYAEQISVYPTLSTVLSLENLFVVFTVLIVNLGIYSKLKQVRQILARLAYVLVTDPQLPPSPSLHRDFLTATDLPPEFSVDSLRKMNARHFNSFNRSIARAVSARREEWIKRDIMSVKTG